jgi:hypothetical protein
LHGGRDHHGGERDVDAIVKRGQHEGLRASSTRTGHTDPIGIDVVQREQKIERPDRVPRLQAHKVLEPQARLHVGETGPVGDLFAVGIADHVVVEHDAPHLREMHHPRLQVMPGAGKVFFPSLLDQFLSLLFAGVVEP